MAEIHNLSEGAKEYFEFSIKGHTYKFRYMNTEEVEQLDKIGDDKKAQEKYLLGFIEKADESSPSFAEISKKMITPEWAKFRAMCKVEFGG